MMFTVAAQNDVVRSDCDLSDCMLGEQILAINTVSYYLHLADGRVATLSPYLGNSRSICPTIRHQSTMR